MRKMLKRQLQKSNRGFDAGMKNYCNRCNKKCNTMDKTRGIPCCDFEKKNRKKAYKRKGK